MRWDESKPFSRQATAHLLEKIILTQSFNLSGIHFFFPPEYLRIVDSLWSAIQPLDQIGEQSLPVFRGKLVRLALDFTQGDHTPNISW